MNITLTKKSIELYKAFNNKKTKLIISYGGTSSGKTISILQLLTTYAIHANANYPKVITIIGESYPVLRRGVMRDWQKFIMGKSFNTKQWHTATSTYKFANNTIIQFISGDNPNKFRGMRSHVVYFDEITNIPKEAYIQLTMRTREKIICSFNPSHKFFITNEMARPDANVIHSTYLDNPFVEQSVADELELRAKTNKNFRDVYVLGKWGSYEGIIFKENQNWHIIKDTKHLEEPNKNTDQTEPKQTSPTNGSTRSPYGPVGKKVQNFKYTFKRVFGLDWGFSNDPTSIVEVILLKTPKGERDILYIKEHLYKTGLLNSDIAKVLREVNIDNELVIADSADPKSIATFVREYRMQMEPAVKGKGSVLSGINQLLEYDIQIDVSSVNIINEFRNYSWEQDKEGEQLTQPIDMFNHGIDAIRYAVKKLAKVMISSNISCDLI